MGRHHRAVDELAGRLSGAVCEPGSPDYLRAVAIDNGRTRTLPAYVVLARSPADVALTIRFAKELELPMTVRGGGHSAAGYCLNRGGVVLDLSLMKDITLERATDRLRVQMGAIWSDVYSFVTAEAAPLIPIGGGCLTVGLPGFLQGGGYSFVSRSYGLGSDNVTEIKLVDAAGRLRTLTADAPDPADRELFWACRGGGGGNFGVAVEMTLQLHRPNAATVMGGELFYPLERSQEVISAYDEWARDLPDTMAAYGYAGFQTDPAEPTRQIPTFRITPVFNGGYAEGAELIQPMLRLDPYLVNLYSMPLPAWESTIGRSTLVGDRQAYIRSGMIGEAGWTREMIDALVHYIMATPSPDSFVVWTHGRGKVADPDGDNHGPYPHRDSRYVFELKGIWDDPAAMRTNVEWAFDFGEAFSDDFEGAYVNYIDPLQKDWADAYYGPNLARLRAVKADADPEGFFRFQQAVDSDFEPDLSRPLNLSPLNRTIV